MKTFLIITVCLYFCNSYSLGRVIVSEESDTPQNFNHEYSDSQNLLQQLVWNMYQESKMSDPNSYTNVKIINNCEHSLEPHNCPLCILRIRKTIVMNVPNDNALSYLSIDSNFNGTHLSSVNKFADGILNNNKISNQSEDADGIIKMNKSDSTIKNELDKENDAKVKLATNKLSKVDEFLLPRCLNFKNLNRNINSENNDSKLDYAKHGELKEILNNFASFKEMSNPIVLETSKFNKSEDACGSNNDRIQIKSLEYPDDSRNNLPLPHFLHKIFSNSWIKQIKDTPILSHKNDTTTIL